MANLHIGLGFRMKELGMALVGVGDGAGPRIGLPWRRVKVDDGLSSDKFAAPY